MGRTELPILLKGKRGLKMGITIWPELPYEKSSVSFSLPSKDFLFPLFLVLSLLLFPSCQPEPEKEKSIPIPETAGVQVPSFNSDSAFAFVKSQVDFGPRAMNTGAHELCGKFLIEKLREYSDTL